MSARELSDLTAVELLAGYRKARFSPSEVVAAVIESIPPIQAQTNAFLALDFESAVKAGRVADAAYVAGTTRPLEGIPFAVKDLFDTRGLRTTYGSAMFAEHVPTTDARAVEKTKAAGAILVAKTSTDEFAMGIANVNPHFGAVLNPWDTSRITGGSSGGSAAAVAAGAVPLALGTDSGGSIRVPASFCGIVGFKPTYGAISTDGVFPLAPSLDHVGPMARSPGDAALLFSCLAERQERAGTAARQLTLGVCEDLHTAQLTEPVGAVFGSALRTFDELGHRIAAVRLASAAEFRPSFDVVRDAELTYVHRSRGLFPERRADYADDVLWFLEHAEHVSLERYLDVQETRRRLRRDVDELFRTADLLVLPVTSAPAPPIETDSLTLEVWDSVSCYTIPANLLGLPSCALRAGFDDGLPVGIQIVGPPGCDELVLRTASAFFDATESMQTAVRPSSPPA